MQDIINNYNGSVSLKRLLEKLVNDDELHAWMPCFSLVLRDFS